jgi:hypothetical protein
MLLRIDIVVNSLRPNFFCSNLSIERITISMILFSSLNWVKWIQFSCWEIRMFLWIYIVVNSLRPFNIFLHFQTIYIIFWSILKLFYLNSNSYRILLLITYLWIKSWAAIKLKWTFPNILLLNNYNIYYYN